MYNILICDDEKDIVNALKIYLSAPDLKFYEAENGIEALDIIKTNEIHLMLNLFVAFFIITFCTI